MPKACIFLSEEDNGEISGQAIVRIEHENNYQYSFFSTLYVADEFRRKGIAKKLIEAVLIWSQDNNLKKVTYNTAKNHTPIISLFEKFGFKEVLHTDNMVKLALLL